jgi:FtsH-binding integral membrane protein
VLRIVAVLFITVYALTVVWPSGWVWHPDNPAYLQMILGIYATLGVFLWRAAANPAQHLSLIWFTVWSSVVHATIMAVHAVTDSGERGHLPGDVAALFLIAAALAYATAKTPMASKPSQPAV